MLDECTVVTDSDDRRGDRWTPYEARRMASAALPEIEDAAAIGVPGPHWGRVLLNECAA